MKSKKNTKLFLLFCIPLIVIMALLFKSTLADKKFSNINTVLKLGFTQDRTNTIDWATGAIEIKEIYKDYFTEKGMDSFFYHYHLEINGGGLCENSTWVMEAKAIEITPYDPATNYFSFDVEVLYHNTADQENGVIHITGKFRMVEDNKIEYWTTDIPTQRALMDLREKFQS